MKLLITKEQNEKLNQKVKSMVEKHGVEQVLKMFDNNPYVFKKTYKNNPSSFLEQFNDLTSVKKGDKIYYVDKDRIPLFYYFKDKKSDKVFIDYYRIWMFFSYILGFKISKVQDIMSKWLEKSYNLRGLIPKDLAGFRQYKLDETYNLKKNETTNNRK